MKVFVTGGAGFIGSNVVDLLIKEGHEVTVYDNLSKGYKEFVNPKAKFIQEDLANQKVLNEVIVGHDSVIHLAAESVIAHSMEKPEEHLKRNVNYAINLLEAMRINNIKKIVFSSSAAVYGESKKPVKEDIKKEPLQPYGASKLAIEAILSGYYHAFGICSTSLRYFNVYGPRDDQIPVTRAIPKWFKAVLTGRSITLNWKGQQIRDYVYVKDLAKAHLKALGKCDGYKQYNIGSGSGQKMIDILEMVFKVCGKKTEVIDAGDRLGDPMRLVADISKAKSELKWAPETSLEKGIREAYNFYMSHPESLKRI